MAFRDLADNVAKVGNLNISPDLLGALLGAGTGEPAGEVAERNAPAQTRGKRN
ncbi:MAG: hypothetical protein PHO07_05545 [Pirellulales bacterium]|jgi:hypothetical protein|nr:hypothetical protein [Thermoguttaceae bacterium]MDD4786620.1 hypothetical protein [Pirellulales bacterium]MDI9446689.1 hypothetical protein [Planctomycetota bacterium]NLZ01212.1 hypothetical protein [Pirellulaceae bacterium]